MTLSNLVNAVTFTGNGVTTVFPYAFNIPDADSIEVVIYDTTTFSEVTLDEGTDYTASAYDNDAGGNVTYTGGGTPLPATQTLTIRRKPPLEQGLLLTTQSNFAPAALMDQLDKIVMMIQAQKTDLDKALIVPQGETDSPSAIMTSLLAYLAASADAFGVLNTLIPALHNTYDIGAVGTRWRNGFFQGNIRAATPLDANSDDVVTRGATQTLTNKTLANYQPVNALLTALAGLTGVNGSFIRFTGAAAASMQAIVGTVTQSGGTPTGALFEKGSNANGNYTRFADGTMICRRTASHDLTSTSTQTWTMSSTFASTPIGGVVGLTGNTSARNDDWYAGSGVGWASSSTQWSTRAAKLAGTATISAHLLAVGDWF